jgi:hypothetical protein
VALHSHETVPSATLRLLTPALAWLRHLLAWQIDLTRRTFGALADDEYRGLYIPDAEADLLGADEAVLPPDLQERRSILAAERAAWMQLWLEAEAQGAAPPLRRLAASFELSDFACDVLLLALAPEIDLRFERLYAYIQDDVTRKRPSVDLALRLLCATPAERVTARAAFAADAPLRRRRLIELVEDGQRSPPLLGRFIKIDDRIVSELLGRPAPDALIAEVISCRWPERTLDDLILTDELVVRLRQALAAHPQGLVLALQGGYGSGRRAVAEALCAELGRPLLTCRSAPAD